MSVWKYLRIKDISTLGSGTTPSTKNESYYENGTNPWLNTGSVQDCLIEEASDYVTDKALNETSLKFYPQNTLLLAMYGGGTIGNVGLMTFPSTINQACCAMIMNKFTNPKFVFYSLLSKKTWIISRGFGGTQINLNQGQISRFGLSIPSPEEQSRIVSYLDSKTAAIDKQVTLLSEKRDAYLRLKKSIINRAVTKGLNPDVRMKDSGVEWIGEIPEGWLVRRIKEITKSIKSGGTPKSSNENFYNDEGTPWVSIGDMSTTNYVYDTAKKLTEEGIADKSLIVFPKGTIIYSIFASIGKVSELAIPATINQAILALDFKKIITPTFMKYQLRTIEDFVTSRANGNTQLNLNAGIVSNLKILLPPLSEQQSIADYLDDKCSKIDAIVSNINTQIEKYKLLKRALINEVVTGKRTV